MELSLHHNPSHNRRGSAAAAAGLGCTRHAAIVLATTRHYVNVAAWCATAIKFK